MDEAYTALYQEFVRLQSLCLKQAGMLQHLSDTIKQQQESASLCQCPAKKTGHQPHRAESRGSPRHPTKTHILNPQSTGFSLSAHGLSHIDKELDQLLLNLDMSNQKQGSRENVVLHNPGKMAENSARDDLRKVEQHYYANQTSQRLRRPWSSSFLDSELISQAGGLFMSGMNLQSQVCEFCHAVFPENTCTRGEFLRHLTTHMT